MNKRIATVIGILLMLGLAGCLISITEKFEFNVTDRTGPLNLAGTDGDSVKIDLNENDTFESNQDKIKVIDRAGFEATLYTRIPQTAVIDISFRRNSKDDWTLLVAGVSVAALSSPVNPTEISFKESENLIQNFAYFQTVAEGGVMQLQLKAQAGNDQVTVTNLVLIVMFTAGT
jgi:hypothetical protein